MPLSPSFFFMCNLSTSLCGCNAPYNCISFLDLLSTSLNHSRCTAVFLLRIWIQPLLMHLLLLFCFSHLVLNLEPTEAFAYIHLYSLAYISFPFSSLHGKNSTFFHYKLHTNVKTWTALTSVSIRFHSYKTNSNHPWTTNDSACILSLPSHILRLPSNYEGQRYHTRDKQQWRNTVSLKYPSHNLHL